MGLDALCVPRDTPASVDQIVRRIEEEAIRYVFVGERHEVGPVKRFAAELANALVDRGHDVGLYVEGFRVGCETGHAACSRLARLFNPEAFSALLRESRALVHPLDPVDNDRRAERMAATIASGQETIRVVLVGRSHVVSAWDPDVELRIYGGGKRYPDPGDLAEAFPRHESLTMTLEDGDERGDYTLRADGCAADYRLAAGDGAAY